MSTIIVTIVVAILGSSCFSGVVMFFIQRHFAQKDKVTEEYATFKMVLEAVAHDAFFEDCRRLLRKDTISEEELDNHNYLYKAYHSLGLNSTGDRMHQLILEKPVEVSVK